jgi:hypothetical protein
MKDTLQKRAARLAKSLRQIRAGDDQPIVNAAANVIEALLERLSQDEGVINHLSVKRMEAEAGVRFGEHRREP